MVVKDEVLDAHRDLAGDLFEAFAASKRRYVERLRKNAVASPTRSDALHTRVLSVTGNDPLPYGIEPNRPMIELLLRHAVRQNIVPRPLALEELFAKGTHHLSG